MADNDRLLEVIRSVFGNNLHNLSDDDGLNTVQGWDSAGHLNLIMAVEAEFEHEFDPSEFSELVSVGALRERLGGH